MVVVITYNLEYGAKNYGVRRASNIIARSEADVALLQENTPKNAAMSIAAALDWFCIVFGRSGTAIISRDPIDKVEEGSHYGIAKIGPAYYCVVHLSDYPYIPFEASGIDYPPKCSRVRCFKSSDSRVLERRSLRLRKTQLRNLVLALQSLKGKKIIVGGDFNEPSYQDWSPEEAVAGRVPISIEFPITGIMRDLGFSDTYRHLHPSISEDPGYTWPDREIEYEYRPDRIDFIFSKNINHIASSDVISSGLSDHAIVRTIFKV